MDDSLSGRENGFRVWLSLVPALVARAAAEPGSTDHGGPYLP